MHDNSHSNPARSSLPAVQRRRDAAAWYSPNTPLETALVRLWSEVLEVSEVGANEDFFRLGGESIMAAQIVLRVREALRLDFTVREFLKSPTVAGMAQALAIAPPLQSDAWPAPQDHAGECDRLFPLSPEQEGIWFTQQLRPDNTAFNVIDSERMLGPVNTECLRQAVREVARRQAVLRTTFPVIQGRPFQRIAPEIEPEFRVIETPGTDQAERRRRAIAQANLAAQRPFDLVGSPPWRLYLYRIASDEHVFLLTMHHIITDDWSLTLFIEDVAKYYDALLDGVQPALRPLPFGYVEFAAWRHRWLQSAEAGRQRSYWKGQLVDTPVLALPTDAPRPSVQTYRGSYRSRLLHDDLLTRIRNFSRQEGTTPFVLLLAVFHVLLSRYTNEFDIPVGVPISL